ncbi:MAG: HD domain-containing phosphohydrolase [Planctomycetota bacterium]
MAKKWFSRLVGGSDEQGEEPPKEASLVALSGSLTGKSFALEQGKELTGGRSEQCDMHMPAEGVSRKHFSVTGRDGKYFIADLGSSNGTLVNGQKIRVRGLREGDKIRVGFMDLEFRGPDVPKRPPSDRFPFKADTTITKRIDEDEIGSAGEGEIDAARSREMLRTLYKVGNIINAESDRTKIFETIMDAVFSVFEANRGFLLLYDPETGLFERIVVRGQEGRADFNPSKTILLESVRKGLSILSTDTMQDDRFKSGESVVLSNIRSAMCAPLESRQSILGALYVDNISVKGAFTEFDLEVFSAIGKQAGIAVEKLQLAEENTRLFYNTIRTLVATIEAKDEYTGGHTERVATYALQIAEEMGLTTEDLEILRLAGLLHDVGKIGIAEKILRKPGRLTPDEFDEMKKHPGIGARIAANIEDIDKVQKIILHHHEKFDGTGYPDGLKGEDIPIGARILAAADAYDAMTSQRSYRRDFNEEEVINEYKRTAGHHFDPQVAEAFLSALSKGKMVTPEFLSVTDILTHSS